jgi:hypothetical protein
MGCDDDTRVNITCNPAAYPVTGGYATLQNIADGVLGIGATIVGIPYQVYRVTSASNGDVIQPGNLIFTAFPCQRQKYRTDVPADIGLETLDKDNFIYSLTGDMRPILVGDIFVQADPVYGPGYTSTVYATQQFNGYCIASLAPLKSRIAGRVDRLVQVYRKPLTANAAGYYDKTLSACDQLVCTAGLFQLQPRLLYPDAVASLIPCGFQEDKRSKGTIIENAGQLPSMPPRTSWNAYVMPLPGGEYFPAPPPGPGGFIFRQDDILVDQDGGRYVVTNNYRQDTGFVGAQLTLDLYVGQP